ncbi:hypothetical protein KSC_083140 [Ktedonobacter sp. SOSP1-52]|nr:hypothetical protein KSC_083140 [Ktedonobacter sp. SOSP1-52]
MSTYVEQSEGVAGKTRRVVGRVAYASAGLWIVRLLAFFCSGIAGCESEWGAVVKRGILCVGDRDAYDVAAGCGCAAGSEMGEGSGL